MSQLIDGKDLCAGSYVQNPEGKLLTVTRVLPSSIVALEKWTSSDQGQTVDINTFCPIGKVKPIAITPEWLLKLGFLPINDVPGSVMYGWQWNKEFNLYDFELEEVDSSDWNLLSDSHFLAKVEGVHHLQALIWNLERVWLTIAEKEVVSEQES